MNLSGRNSIPHGDPVRQVVVVGGGTAGWLSANYIANRLPASQACSVKVIEPKDIPVIGVGEATIPTIGKTMNFLGIPEAEWMAECNATFKLAIKFINWSTGDDDDCFWHPFDSMATDGMHQISIAQHWLRLRASGYSEPFDSSCFASLMLTERGKAPKRLGHWYGAKIPYAYHLDAILLGQFLKKRAVSRGVGHIQDKVISVKTDEQGFITAVRTVESGEVEGDLFIDCSGFRGLLINEALGAKFESFSESLLCDRAVAIQREYDVDEKIRPYTTATAVKAGWIWDTPLSNRVGNGYVYSSAFSDEETAERDLRGFLQVPNSTPARHLKMRVGMTTEPWKKNCVSIGL